MSDKKFMSVEQLDSGDFLESTTAKRNALEERAAIHISNMVYVDYDGIDKSHPSFLPPHHPDFELPSKELTAKVVEIISKEGYGREELASLLGVTSRALRNWISLDEKQANNTINKSNWFLLTQLAGLTLVTMRPHKAMKDLVREKLDK